MWYPLAPVAPPAAGGTSRELECIAKPKIAVAEIATSARVHLLLCFMNPSSLNADEIQGRPQPYSNADKSKINCATRWISRDLRCIIDTDSLSRRDRKGQSHARIRHAVAKGVLALLDIAGIDAGKCKLLQPLESDQAFRQPRAPLFVRSRLHSRSLELQSMSREVIRTPPGDPRSWLFVRPQ